MTTHQPFGSPRRERRHFYINLIFVAAAVTLFKAFAVALTSGLDPFEAPFYFGAFGLLVLVYQFAKRTQREEDYYALVPWRFRKCSPRRTPHLPENVEALSVAPVRYINPVRSAPRVVAQMATVRVRR